MNIYICVKNVPTKIFVPEDLTGDKLKMSLVPTANSLSPEPN